MLDRSFWVLSFGETGGGNDNRTIWNITLGIRVNADSCLLDIGQKGELFWKSGQSDDA